MLAVLAYGADPAARALCARWQAAGAEAGVLTAADVAQAGWRFRPGNDASGRMIIEGRSVATRDLRGVVTRMPVVHEAELAHLHQDDRAYAVAEVQAFLLAWLSQLSCPVINRPSATSLLGPAFTTSEWVLRARRLGIPARSFVQRAQLGLPQPLRVGPGAIGVDVVRERTFIDGHALGPGQAPLGRAAAQLAVDAGAELLRVWFALDEAGGFELLDAGCWVELGADEVAEAVTQRLLGERRTGARSLEICA